MWNLVLLYRFCIPEQKLILNKNQIFNSIDIKLYNCWNICWTKTLSIRLFFNSYYLSCIRWLKIQSIFISIKETYVDLSLWDYLKIFKITDVSIIVVKMIVQMLIALFLIEHFTDLGFFKLRKTNITNFERNNKTNQIIFPLKSNSSD